MTVDVVIGGALGMGEAAVRALSGSRRLLVADRSLTGALRVAAEVGPPCEAVQCDVTDDGRIAHLASMVDSLGSLVITAGISSLMGDARQIYRVNLVGTAKVLRALHPAVGPESVAICLASMAAHRATPPSAAQAAIDDPPSPELIGRLEAAGVDLGDSALAYSYSKLGVKRLVEASAQAWGARGARILSISPGVIDTPMGQLAMSNRDMGLQREMSGWPIPRLGSAAEVGSVIAFLCSPGASYMTGSDVAVDGGAITARIRHDTPAGRASRSPADLEWG
jgi:NAD(P)-dependent dehydrogenase (short-subunit alcohol dehydrogenase family)